MNTTTENDLAGKWAALLEAEPKLRIRDAAERLGVSEAELLATRVGNGAKRLEGDWKDLIKEFPRLGRVMCLTRNENAVHERYGIYREIAFFGHGAGMGQVVGPDIDLRLFMGSWVTGFAVTDETKEGTRQSFHFFDGTGTAVQKIYLQPESDLAAYNELVEKFLAADQNAAVPAAPAAPKPPEKPDSEVDVEAFRQEWLNLKDTHQFFILMRRYGLTREQALRLAPEGYAWKVKPESTEIMLKTAAERGTPIMCFVGSEGCIQIHTGPVQNIKWFGPEWLNVLDDEFNLHLRNTAVANAWVVRKETAEGVVTALELYDKDGENIALFFGKRKPGELEDEAWRAIAHELPRL